MAIAIESIFYFENNDLDDENEQRNSWTTE